LQNIENSPLKVEQWPTDRLVEYARNPRKNDDKVDRMVAAIREFGFRIPICAKSDGTVVDGHLRFARRRKALICASVSSSARATGTSARPSLRGALRRSATWAEWDDELLRIELGELKLSGFDLSLTASRHRTPHRKAGR
jgi:hypothetical protein